MAPKRWANIKAYKHDWYLQNKQRMAPAMNAATARRSQAVKDFLNQYKLMVGCADCGYKENSSALEFDHVFGKKTYPVTRYRSIPAATREMQKCQVRCSNCHSIRTYKSLVSPTKAASDWKLYNTAGISAGLIF